MTIILRILISISMLLPLFLNANVNDEFIINKKESFEKWSKNLKYVEGAIYLDGDTQTIDILDFTKTKKKYYNVFCVVRYANDSISFLSAKNINGFKVNNEEYQANFLMEEPFFMHKVSSGRIELFVKEKIPSDERYLYFFKPAGIYSYYMLNPLESNILFLKATAAGLDYISVEIETKKLDESFKQFVNMQMGDCSEIRNLANSEFYKMQDLAILVDKYNAWFQKNKIAK